MRRHRFVPILGAIVLTLGATAYGAAPVTIKAYPQVAFAGSGLRVTVRVEKHEDNRRLALVWEGPTSGSTDRPHVGLDAPLQIVFEKEFPRMEAGVTSLLAIVQRQSPEGKITELRSQVIEVTILEGLPQ